MENNRAFRLRQSMLLLFASVIWGVAFVAQSVGMEHVGPFTFIAVRFALGALTLLPVILVQGKRKRTDGRAMGGPILLRGGVLCGLALVTASSFQQIGILYTTVGKAGFVTAMYILIVPILGLLIGRKTKKLIWLCAAIAAAGLYLLCMGGGRITLQMGDALCLVSAGIFAVQIMLVDHFADLADGVRLSAVEFLTVSAVGTVLMLLFEHPTMEALRAAALPLLYAGVMSSGVAYTLQIVGQRGLNPTVASLIMSLESTFSVIAGFVFLHQSLSARELAGCALMAAAIVLAQL